jgi:signal transduction histidine kinase
LILGFPKGIVELDPASSDAPVGFATVAELEQHMARELHDQVAQPLISLLLDLYELRSSRRPFEAMVGDIATVEESVRGVLRQTREIMLDLRGQGDIRRNFIRAVRDELQQRSGLREQPETALRVSPHWPRRINGWAAFNLLRIIQEALANASRHGRARKIEVVFEVSTAGVAMIQVLDDGYGIGSAAPGFGMTGMEERATILGGTFEAMSRPGGGNIIEVRVPVSRLE